VSDIYGSPQAGIRAFVAIRVGSEIESRIGAFIAQMAPSVRGVSWVAPVRLHLTLRFLGDSVDPSLLHALTEAIAKAAADFAPFRIAAHGVGAFPSLQRPRVLWIGLAGAPLPSIADAIDRKVVGLGFPPRDHEFSPHLTIGRVRSPKRFSVKSIEIIRRAANREFGQAEIRELILFRSYLSSEGSRYEPLERFRLADRQIGVGD
jgi:2'-5' RNA ligase